MNGWLVVTVPRSLGGVRVDRAVAMLSGVSRARAAALVAQGDVLVNGRTETSRSATLAAGGELSVRLPEETEQLVAPDPTVPFIVVHEDPVFVVVDKPAGVVVHPGAGHREGTLVAGLLARFPDVGGLAGDPCGSDRPGIVHRLDRGTSGLLVVARTADAYRSLATQMAARTVDRRYLALVSGHVEGARGMVDAPIGRSARTPTLMAVSAGGRPARTAYEVLDRVDVLEGRHGPVPAPATLVACSLETGRTHQIRVHLAAIGHPVLGDERYGRPPRGVMPSGRLFLHASELAIDHPSTGERMAWTSPLPEDLTGVIGGALRRVLRADDGAVG